MPLNTEPVPARPQVNGGVRLHYQTRENGCTSLQEQWVRPPLHLAKTYEDKSWALNLLTSPTAGLLQGDTIEIDCRVKAKAKAALVSPAACRVHTMTSGKASISQAYHVEENSCLDVWPAPLILQKDARLEQETSLYTKKTSTVLLTEIISPGRASYGESFAFQDWKSKLRIHQNEELIAFENFRLTPSEGDAADWRKRFPNGPYASIYFLTPESTNQLIEPIHALSSEEESVGASPLHKGGLGIKEFAKDGLALRKVILAIRELLIAASGIEFPHMLKRAQTFFY